MSLANQIASAIELAQFHQLNDLSRDLWKAYAAGHLDDDQAQGLSEAIEAKRPQRPAVEPTSSKPVRLQRSPDKQASIERRRRLARQSPVPPELVDKFTQGEHAVLTVVCGEVQRGGRIGCKKFGSTTDKDSKTGIEDWQFPFFPFFQKN